MSLLADLEALAVSFAREVLAAALRSSTLLDLASVGARASVPPGPRLGSSRAAEPERRGSRRGARTAPADISAKALEVLRRSPDGVRTETLRTLVGGPKPAYQRAMSMLVTDGLVSKTGAKRGTTYQAA